MVDHRRYDNGSGCCGSCCGIIITSGLTALLLWLSLRTSFPTCSVQDFYVPALNKSLNSTDNHTLYFDLKLDNKMNDKGVHYANISLTFFYNDSAAVANYSAPDFYQGHKKSTRRKALLQAATGVPWADAIGAVSNGSRVGFTVRLAARVKFKIMFWYTKRHAMVVAANVEVNDSGKKVNKKGIKLKSGTTGFHANRVGVGSVGIPVFLLIGLLL